MWRTSPLIPVHLRPWGNPHPALLLPPCAGEKGLWECGSFSDPGTPHPRQAHLGALNSHFPQSLTLCQWPKVDTWVKEHWVDTRSPNKCPAAPRVTAALSILFSAPQTCTFLCTKPRTDKVCHQHHPITRHFLSPSPCSFTGWLWIVFRFSF